MKLKLSLQCSSTFRISFTDGSNPEPPPAQVSCPEGFTPYWYECFRFYPDVKDWTRANEECESQKTMLPSVHSWAENAVIHIMVLRTGNPVWIGLRNWEVSVSQALYYDTSILCFPQ